MKKIQILFCLFLVERERNDLLRLVDAGDISGNDDRISAVRTAAGCSLFIRHDRSAAGIAGIHQKIAVIPLFIAHDKIRLFIEELRIEHAFAERTLQFLRLCIKFQPSSAVRTFIFF